MKSFIRWITILLLICFPLQNYAAVTLLLCQHPIKEPLVFHSAHSSPTHHLNPSGYCDHCSSCCPCCGISTALSSFALEIEKTLSSFFFQTGDQFIPEQPQRPPQTFLL